MHAHVDVRVRIAQIITVAACAAGVAACTTTVETRDPVTGEPEVVYVDNPPLELSRYPHESYQGREIYLVGDRWQYQAGGRWVTYRHEPRELEIRRRAPHQQALVHP